MAVFRFTLQKVLEQRIRVEDERKNDLARVQGRINRETVRIDELAARRRAAKSGGARVLAAAETALHVMLMQGSCDRADAARRKIKSLAPALERARAAYVKARQDRMALEKIKEKQLSEFRKQERLAEQRTLSETAEQQYMRRTMEEEHA